MTELQFKEGKLYLKTPGAIAGKKDRLIGVLKKRRTLSAYRDPVKHLFRKNNSLAMNYEVLKNGGAYFDKIEIQFGFDTLQTTREFWLEKGEFMHFANQGYEKQLFLKLKDFGLDKANEHTATQERFQRRRQAESMQVSLF